METTKKHSALLFALVIPALLAGCKPYGSLFEALISANETLDASNSFVGVWELHRHGPVSVYSAKRYIYEITGTGRWEFCVVFPNGYIEPLMSGTYNYRGSVLYMTHLIHYHYADVGINYAVRGPSVLPVVNEWRLDGNELKMDKTLTTLRRISEDCSDVKQILKNGQVK